MLCDAMQRIPGNRAFTSRYEVCISLCLCNELFQSPLTNLKFASTMGHFWGRKGEIVGQILVVLSLQASNIATIIVSAQVFLLPTRLCKLFSFLYYSHKRYAHSQFTDECPTIFLLPSRIHSKFLLFSFTDEWPRWWMTSCCSCLDILMPFVSFLRTNGSMSLRWPTKSLKTRSGCYRLDISYAPLSVFLLG